MAEKFDDLIFEVPCQGLKLLVDQIYHSIAESVVYVNKAIRPWRRIKDISGERFEFLKKL